MLDQLKTNKWAVVAAVAGGGFLIGVSSGVLFIRSRLSSTVDQSHSAASVASEIKQLNQQIKALQEAIMEMKQAQEERRNHQPLKSSLKQRVKFEQGGEEDEISRAATISSSASVASTTEYFSAISSDNEDEFFDLDEEEVLTSRVDDLDEIENSLVAFYKQVDDLLEAQDLEAALDLLKSREIRDSERLWRMSKALYHAANLKGVEGDDSTKKELIEEAVTFGEQAVESGEDSSDAHKWYAIAVGCRGEFLGIKDKILGGYEFKKHVDKAAELNPNDHTVHHLLGRFCYELASLSWIERKTASTLFAEPPSASMDEAKGHFLEAEKMKPEGWKENRLFLAKSCVKNGEYAEAARWAKKGLDLPVCSGDDRSAHEELQGISEKYQSYL